MDFDYFTIQVPSSWEIIKLASIDSYVGKIKLDSADELFFDLGWYSNSLSDDTTQSNISWDTINGYRAKFLIPKQSGKGVIGIYIDSISGQGSERNKFVLGGRNLNPENEKLFLSSIKTLKFIKEE